MLTPLTRSEDIGTWYLWRKLIDPEISYGRDFGYTTILNHGFVVLWNMAIKVFCE